MGFRSFLYSIVLTVALVLTACGSKSETQALSGHALLEVQLLESLNSIRSAPQSHVAPLQYALDYFKGTNANLVDRPLIFRNTSDFENAIVSAIEDIKVAKAYGGYQRSSALDRAAQDHQRDQAKTGQTGHDGSDGSHLDTRVLRYASNFYSIGENIAYGYNQAITIAYALYVDDGILDRGHRINMQNPDFREVGISCGDHPRYRVSCVIDYGFNIVPK